MLRIERYSFEEIKDRYMAIHNEVFGDMPFQHVPGLVYLGYEDETYVGFMSAYYHDMATLYIQRIGIPVILRGEAGALTYFKAIMAYFKKEAHRFLLGHVENTNIPTLMIALRTGWIINGVHTDTAGNVYVRILKDLGG